MSRRTIKLLAFCVLAILAVWLGLVLVGAAQTVWYREKGLYETVTLGLEDMTLTAIKPYDKDTPPEETWFVSTDSDPQMLWEGEAYLNRVVLKVEHSRPGNGVELYYRLAGQEDFSQRQIIYARQNSEGWYEFDLRGKLVSGIRIDPDSEGGVLTRFEGVELNALWPWQERMVPTPGQAMVLLCLPVVAAAVIGQGLKWKRGIY